MDAAERIHRPCTAGCGAAIVSTKDGEGNDKHTFHADPYNPFSTFASTGGGQLSLSVSTGTPSSLADGDERNPPAAVETCIHADVDVIAGPAIRMKSTGHLESEDDEGNCEYKWRLTGITEDRFEHLVTQMKFRVAEGQGRSVYEIGVADDGSAVGLHDEDYEESIATVRRMAEALGYQFKIVFERTIEDPPEDDEDEDGGGVGGGSARIWADPTASSLAAKAFLSSSAVARQHKQRNGRRGRRAAARGAATAASRVLGDAISHTTDLLSGTDVRSHVGAAAAAFGANAGDLTSMRRGASAAYVNAGTPPPDAAAAAAAARHYYRSRRRRCAEIHVTRIQKRVEDLRIAFCGLGGAGKSTLVGVLTQGALDDGSGSVRSTVFNHKHEVDTGCTSSVTNHVIGFDEIGRVTNYDEERLPLSRTPILSPTLSSGAANTMRAKEMKRISLAGGDKELSDGSSNSRSQSRNGAEGNGEGADWAEECAATTQHNNHCDEGVHTLDYALNATRTIAERSVKLVTLLDLGGQDKYSKTAYFGITSKAPGYACIVASADRSIIEGIGLHVSICLAMRVPFCIVVTKCDIVGELELDDVQLEIDDFVRGEAKHMGYSMPVKTRTCCGYEDVLDEALIAECVALTTVPVFLTSCVEGQGIGYVKTFFHKLPSSSSTSGAASGAADDLAAVKSATESVKVHGRLSPPAEVLVDGCFNVSSVGAVLSGLVIKGEVHEGQRLLMGPDRHGNFQSISVSGIHDKGSHVTRAGVGTDATFCVGHIPPTIDANRKGTVLYGIGAAQPLVSYVFECRVRVIDSRDVAAVAVGQEPILHCRNIRQAIKIIRITALMGLAGEEGEGGMDELGPRREGILVCRLLYHPEVLERGASLLLRWNRSVRAVGNVTRIVPFAESLAHDNNSALVSPGMRPTPFDAFEPAELTSQIVLSPPCEEVANQMEGMELMDVSGVEANNKKESPIEAALTFRTASFFTEGAGVDEVGEDDDVLAAAAKAEDMSGQGGGLFDSDSDGERARRKQMKTRRSNSMRRNNRAMSINEGKRNSPPPTHDSTLNTNTSTNTSANNHVALADGPTRHGAPVKVKLRASSRFIPPESHVSADGGGGETPSTQGSSSTSPASRASAVCSSPGGCSSVLDTLGGDVARLFENSSALLVPDTNKTAHNATHSVPPAERSPTPDMQAAETAEYFDDDGGSVDML